MTHFSVWAPGAHEVSVVLGEAGAAGYVPAAFGLGWLVVR